MTAIALKTKLQGELQSLTTEIGSMEAERVSLALPAHSGDKTAMLRLVDLRSDIGARQQGVRDLEQAIDDLDPAVRAEHAASRYTQRVQAHGSYQQASADVLVAMDLIDHAVVQLAKAFQAATEPLTRVRHLAVGLMTPIQPGNSVARQVEQRMLTFHQVGIQSVGELIETALEDVNVLYRQTAPYPLRSEMKLGAEMARALASVEQRVQDAMKADRAEAVLAGVVFEPEKS